MLALNNTDFCFRKEDDNILLAYDVIHNKMYFLRGNTRIFIEELMHGKKTCNLDDKYINYLIEKGIIIGGNNNEAQ